MKKKIFEIEVNRTNTTAKQFYSYCKRALIKKEYDGGVPVDFDEWVNPEKYNSKCDECRFHQYEEGLYTYILEFDEANGHGYMYILELDDVEETEPEATEETTETTETEPEAEVTETATETEGTAEPETATAEEPEHKMDDSTFNMVIRNAKNLPRCDFPNDTKILEICKEMNSNQLSEFCKILFEKGVCEYWYGQMVTSKRHLLISPAPDMSGGA